MWRLSHQYLFPFSETLLTAQSMLSKPLQLLIQDPFSILCFIAFRVLGHLIGPVAHSHGQGLQPIVMGQSAALPGDAGELIKQFVVGSVLESKSSRMRRLSTTRRCWFITGSRVSIIRRSFWMMSWISSAEPIGFQRGL